MTKKLTDVVYEQNRDSKLTRDGAKEAVQMVVKAIQTMLLEDEEVKLFGLGSLKTKTTTPRSYSINGYSGTSKPKRKVKFNLYNAFLETLNEE